MYRIPQFEEKDPANLLDFMRANSFATLIGFDGTYPVATQVPVMINNQNGKVTITGHVMIKTDHFQALATSENVLVLFTGPHAYISAAVYEQPAVASTWNYATVQVKGKIKFLDGVGTRAAIKQLTDHYEDPSKSSAAFHRMDEAYIEKHLKAIAGFEIQVEEINNVFKLSQNHSQQNRNAIVHDLQARNEADANAIAEMMVSKVNSSL